MGLREECGVIGIFGDSEAANIAYLGLYALQHRGQEGCGIVTIDRDAKNQPRFCAQKSFGLVADAFSRDVLAKLPGTQAIGHVRYATYGGHLLQNIQPFHFNTALGPVAIAHNGNLTNADSLRRDLENDGSIFQTTSDTEVFMHLIARSRAATLRERLTDAVKAVRGAYSLLVLTADRMFAVRDPFGFRPLVYGRRGEAFIVASESCALDLVEAQLEREVKPGEILEIRSDGIRSDFPHALERPASYCAFEPIYFSRPDSLIGGNYIYDLRRQLGVVLAREAKVEADLVIAIPDSGVPMAIGYAAETKLPLELGLVRNHYVGRTFIEPSQAIRDFGVKLKLNPVGTVLKGKRVVVVDDSIVRGTTSIKIIRMLRQAGAREIHFRIGSPPIRYSCFYGVDTPNREKLLAAQKTVEGMRDYIGADSLAFLSLDGLKQALQQGAQSKFCFACFNGEYREEIFRNVPVQPTDPQGPGIRA